MIRVSIDDLDEIRKKLDPKAFGVAVERAISTATARVRTRLSREVRKEYNIKAGDIAAAVALRKVLRGDNPSGLLVYTGGRLSLAKFGARTRQVTVGERGTRRKLQGVTVQVKKQGPRKLVQGGFLAKGRNAREDTPKQIFQREGAARLPIRKLTGPAIPTMVANREIIEGASSFATEVFRRELERQLRLQLGK